MDDFYPFYDISVPHFLDEYKVYDEPLKSSWDWSDDTKPKPHPIIYYKKKKSTSESREAHFKQMYDAKIKRYKNYLKHCKGYSESQAMRIIKNKFKNF